MSENSGSCTGIQLRGSINSRRMACTLFNTSFFTSKNKW